MSPPRPSPARPVRIGIVCDYAEEGWPSMDLAADLLVDALRLHAADGFDPTPLRPAMPRVARRIAGGRGIGLNGDRLFGRYAAYPRWLARRRSDFGLFHVVDHSYAHLVHALPAERTVVTCHDLDAFRSLLEPEAEPRPAWFRALMRRVLGGMRRAARVVCDSAAVRDQILAHGLISADRLRVIPLPIHPAFTPDPYADADASVDAMLGPADPASPELLHVGSTVDRKRIDVLLRVFAAVRRAHPRARLVRAGGTLTAEQQALAADLGVTDAIVSAPFLGRDALAAVYRRAALVLVPSEREGFGFPVVEALACGTPVIASGIPVLREVGGDAVVYRPIGDVDAWTSAVLDLLGERESNTERWLKRRAEAIGQAANFTLSEYARRTVEVYREVLGMTTGEAGR